MRHCIVCDLREERDGHREFFPVFSERVCAICFTWVIEVQHAIARGVKTLRDEPEAIVDERITL